MILSRAKKDKIVLVHDQESSTGLSPNMELRLLRRCGYSTDDIASMDQVRKASAVQEAIEYGIYAGPLPPSPIERASAEHITFLDIETGRPLTLEQVHERGVCLYKSPEPSKPPPFDRMPTLNVALNLFQEDQTLDLDDREHLKRMVADHRLKDHWEYIVRCCKPTDPWVASAGQFIWHVLAARRAAEFVKDYPERRRHAENAESLAEYLKRQWKIDEQTYRLLKKLAGELREPQELSVCPESSGRIAEFSEHEAD
jgi:hypothetical protein